MRSGIAIGLAMSLVICVGVARGEDSVQGTWKLSSGEAQGQALTAKEIKNAKLVIKGDEYHFTLDGGEAITGVQSLDPTAKLKAIDIKDASGENKGKTCLGIYELKGDEFRVAFAQPGQPRPTKFSTAADSGNWVHVWKRVKE